VEKIELELTEFTLRSGSIAVSHVAHGLSRGLEPGELVVIRDRRSGRHYSAAVADIDFEAGDTVYRVEVGAPVSAAEADRWLRPAAATGHVTTQEIMALLAELRRGRELVRGLVDRTAP
jgi:hypothetical protein